MSADFILRVKNTAEVIGYCIGVAIIAALGAYYL
jgi:hypothetical protein